MLYPVQGDFLFHAQGHFLQTDAHRRAQILSAHRPIFPGTGLLAENAAKETLKDVVDAAETALKSAETAGDFLGRAELVVASALVRIGEHFVGLVDVAHPIGSARVRVQVRMELPRPLAVGFLDLVRRCLSFHTQDIVVVFFGRHLRPSAFGRSDSIGGVSFTKSHSQGAIAP